MSRRQYITASYLTAYLGSQVLNSDFPTADALIEVAEEMIDGYVGSTRKWFQLDSSFIAGVYTPPDYEPQTPVVKELRGRITAVVSPNQYMIETWQQNAYQENFFQMCNLDIIGGTGTGNSYLISASTTPGMITITNTDYSEVTAAVFDTTSVYRIYQLGKFPRDRDVFYNTFQNPPIYYKGIIEPVREATAAQCEYINQQGIDFFISDASYINAEHIGPYSYTRDPKSAGPRILIAPKAQLLLRGIRNKKGVIVI